MTRKLSFLVAGLFLIGAVIIGYVAYQKKQVGVPQSHHTYTMNLMSGATYPAQMVAMLHFTIQDDGGRVLKNFDTVHEKPMHLIVVRKDRTNFQHVHPRFYPETGVFMIEPFTFPTAGEYRVYADFTSAESQKGPDGTKLAVTSYQDVRVGDAAKYVAQALAEDKLTSTEGGFATSVYFPRNDDSPGGTVGTTFYAGEESTINILINKASKPYTTLQPYLGALGHMVVLGPNLEFIHAHPVSDDLRNQTGLVTFMVNFPAAGRYKLFLQTQASGTVTTTDYTVSVQPNPIGKAQSGDSSMTMDHTSH